MDAGGRYGTILGQQGCAVQGAAKHTVYAAVAEF